MNLPAEQHPAQSRILIPRAPVLAVDGRKVFCLTTEGEITRLSLEDARRMALDTPPIVCHAPQVGRALGLEKLFAFDVLELFAFVHPGKFCAPTPGGIARALNLLEPATAEDRCMALRDAVRHLLSDLGGVTRADQSRAAAVAAMMGLSSADPANDAAESGWLWSPAILAALGSNVPPAGAIKTALKIWDRLPKWAIHAPEPPPGHHGVSDKEARERLQQNLQIQRKTDRPQQGDYAAAIANAFNPATEEGQTRVVLAEAGTGTGKTLGYLAPATVWAEKNGGAVWVSTYTRNLQRQVDTELSRLYDDPVTKSRKVVTRKGRENYLCLLNLEDATQSPTIRVNAPNAIALGLMLRWAEVTEEGDLAGRDFPGWLPGLVGQGRVFSMADRRGECIYSACPHFDRCFIEKSVRKAKRADIVIANHALVMHQTAADGADSDLPARYIFDEGHHLFEAADSAFAAHLNGMETADLRRWILGAETQGKSRLRGLRRRLEELVAADEKAQDELNRVIEAARVLPAQSWRVRLAADEPHGALEQFLALCRKQVYARNKDAGPYSLETPPQPALPGLEEGAAALALKLRDIQRPMLALAAALENKLSDEAEDLNTDARERLRFLAGSLKRRGRGIVGAWIDMLEALAKPAVQETPFVDWFEVTRIDGREFDCGYYRHYIDPARVFAAALKPHAAGVAVTSATLRDVTDDDEQGWKSAMIRAGATALDNGAATRFFHAPSPFDYSARTRVFVIGDVGKDNANEVAAAYRALFLASGGGALGLFTAVQRLKAVHGRLHGPLEDKGLALYAQHADALDTATLIDIFREEENACLLGTDAARDGIDVPGRSLRLVVYDRVPWPRPDILHKARRNAFGRGYDDMLARFRIKQAYGRLIRKSSDMGVFVMLDGALPSRLLTAFPEGVEVVRCGLKEAVEATKTFLSPLRE